MKENAVHLKRLQDRWLTQMMREQENTVTEEKAKKSEAGGPDGSKEKKA